MRVLAAAWLQKFQAIYIERALAPCPYLLLAERVETRLKFLFERPNERSFLYKRLCLRPSFSAAMLLLPSLSRKALPEKPTLSTLVVSRVALQTKLRSCREDSSPLMLVTMFKAHRVHLAQTTGKLFASDMVFLPVPSPRSDNETNG